MCSLSLNMPSSLRQIHFFYLLAAMVLQRCNQLCYAVIVTTSEIMNERLLWGCSRCRFSEYRSLLCLSSSFQCAILGGLRFYSCSLSVEDGILVSIFFVVPFHTNICISPALCESSSLSIMWLPFRWRYSLCHTLLSYLELSLVF